MELRKIKVSLMITIIILLQVFLPLITVIQESKITSKSNAQNLDNGNEIKSISELNTNEEEINSHEGDTANSNVEFNYREKVTLTRDNLDPENEELDYIVYPRLKTLTKETEEGYKYLLTFQNCCTDENGNLTSTNGENIYYTRSKDLENWDKPQKLYSSDGTYNFSSCDTYVLNDGRIMAVATRYRSDTYTFTKEWYNNQGIYLKFSEDNGKTWTEEEKIYTGLCWEPSILQLRSGEIQIYFSHSIVAYINAIKRYVWYPDKELNNTNAIFAQSSPQSQSSGVGMISSIDGGNTWTPDIEGTDKTYTQLLEENEGQGFRNPYSAYRVAQQTTKELLNNDIVNFTGKTVNFKDMWYWSGTVQTGHWQKHLGIENPFVWDQNNNRWTITYQDGTYQETKMTDQMPVAIELNNKDKIVMAMESSLVTRTRNNRKYT